ncbi:hypothetical protein Aspvir_002793 [Aspergillus viridinutans]|uniref:Uncharacterized protein n=1 Tax=Aspergillus viridinutans TaxID=75553 RepID=A0A9P3F9Y1_ASPVI|nr:uncharacterized protein Aspvir_002793 [Aspergillus viridinutans]GIK07138.1 hypothetical protein Aspvir_002793 [Aspergillus viridinutans]
MELAFNVTGPGPLSQVGVHILSLDTAVNLATGAIGWWKSRSRSLSLVESISASKASLVCSSSFNVVSYRDRRSQTGRVRGLAVQNNELSAIPGSIMQTAVSNDPGLDCLRALTTGLLVFYDVQKVTTILADVVPFGMLQPDHDDGMPEFAGPLLSSLRDWVASVAAEEDCNTYRSHLLDLASTAQDKLIGMGIPRSAILDHSADDTNHLLGALRWMVTPRHRRDVTNYPTRSLYVWRTAVVMAELAFDISASSELIQTETQYQEFINNTTDFSHYSDIALVTTSVGDTDPWMLQQVHMESLRLRPQVTPIRSIPHSVFGHVGLEAGNVEPEELVEIWNISFRYAKAAVGAPSLTRGGNVLLPAGSDMELVRESHKHLVGIWSPHMARILRPAMELYIPASSRDPAWSQTEILAYLERQRSGDPETTLNDHDVRNNVLKLSAILLGSIYGACFQSLNPMVAANGREGRDAASSEFLEVAFSPERIIEDKLFRWTATLGLALGGLLESSRWTGLLLELTTGVEHPKPLDEQPSAGLLGRRLNLTSAQSGVINESHVRVSDIFGCQANGVFAISEFIVRPSTDASSSLKFHVGTGRILNLPVDESGYVRESPISASALELPIDPSPSLEMLSRQSGASSTPNDFRIDAEPHWDVNAQNICFVIRSAGVVVSTLRISLVLERLLNQVVSCKCGEPQSSVRVPLSERWQAVTVYQILRPSYPGGSRLSAYIRDEDKIMVDVEGDEVKRILVVGSLRCRKVILCPDCVRCAYDNIKNREKRESVALIVG